VNDSANTWLAIIAIATLLIAIVQVSVLVAAGLLARRLGRLASHIEREVQPMIEHLNAIGRDAARAAALATAQVERADRLFADFTGRVEQGLNTVQHVVSGPAREGAALWSAVRAAAIAFRAPRPRRKRSGADEEDALFI
jgi:hypothetical protein